MKKYHFFVTPAFKDGYLVCERGRGNYFMVRLPTKYRAQILANWLWRHWKNKNPKLQKIKELVCDCSDNWKLLKNLMSAFEV